MTRSKQLYVICPNCHQVIQTEKAACGYCSKAIPEGQERYWQCGHGKLIPERFKECSCGETPERGR